MRKTGAKTGAKPKREPRTTQERGAASDKALGRFAKGDDPRRGVGQPGRSGRKPNAFVAECAHAADAVVLPKVLDYLATHDASDKTRTWQWCADYVTSYGKGKAPQHVTLANDDESPLTSPLDDLTRQLARLAAAGPAAGDPRPV